ncbi:DNA-directed RNA polymerase subunit omega [Effusibacillus pohliae]|uniref:DNA-directed RNA polymerase subunit omega n=1 Tax=Effusibacillus pohliae TaxID=232270 RepID=UPI00037FFB49|nr:DNA-directed RNA polymerase subunit omega [Effusibacillus pohliae]
MLYPSIDKLMEKADSKYLLVVAAAKRARQLQEGAERRVNVNSNKHVTVALNEIYQDKIRYTRSK